jgi:hypothetical protein
MIFTSNFKITNQNCFPLPIHYFFIFIYYVHFQKKIIGKGKEGTQEELFFSHHFIVNHL